MSVCEKKIWNWSKITGVFRFFINWFMKTLIKSIMYCQTVPLERLLTYVLKMVCKVSLPLFLTWVSLAILCLDQCLMEMDCLAQHHLSLARDNLLVHMNLQWWQLLRSVNATYYAQHPTLRSVYRKKQSVVGRKLFSS